MKADNRVALFMWIEDGHALEAANVIGDLGRDLAALRTERDDLRSFLECLINHNKISDELQKDYFLLKARYR